MSRLPIRARLTAVFALAMALLLVAAGLFLYLRLRADLDEGLNEDLRVRAAGLARATPDDRAPTARTGGGLVDETFAQVVDPDGRLLSLAGGARRAVLRPDELPRARRSRITFERRVPGIDGHALVLARPVRGRTGDTVIVVGQSLGDRNEALSGLVTSFAIGGPAAIVLASLLGYVLATAGLAPMEAMRRRAAEVSLSGGGEDLPLPAARDEVHRLGETLNDMLARLRHSFEREQRFVADASHELRTPIAVVKTELEGALRAPGLPPDVREALAAAVEECDRLAQLADDLLVLARASDGSLPVRPERLLGAPTLADARERFVDRASERGRAIRVDAEDGVELWADPLRLRQALNNLVDNAIRHGDGEVTLRARASDGGVELEVGDAGPGFEVGLAEHAFDRFARGDAARTRGGAGLGLAIVLAIAEAHGGRATVPDGAGATVRLWLPAR